MDMFIDHEFINAEKMDEDRKYYFVRYNLYYYDTINKKMYYKNNYIRYYKPSVAKLLEQRTGYVYEPVVSI